MSGGSSSWPWPGHSRGDSPGFGHCGLGARTWEQSVGLRWGRVADHERIGPYSIRHVLERDKRFRDSEEYAAGAGQEDLADTNPHTGADANPYADYLADATADLPNANPDPDPGPNPNANRGSDADTGANPDAITGTDADTHTGPDTDTHTGTNADTHTGPDPDADTGAGARLQPLLRLDQFLEPADQQRPRAGPQLGGHGAGGARRLRRQRKLHQHPRLGPVAGLLAQQ